MAGQAAARLEQPFAALGRRPLGDTLRRIDIFVRLTIGEQELGQRANLDALKTLGVFAIGNRHLIAGRITFLEILAFWFEMLEVAKELWHPCRWAEIGRTANPIVHPVEINLGLQ